MAKADDEVTAYQKLKFKFQTPNFNRDLVVENTTKGIASRAPASARYNAQNELMDAIF